MSTRRTWIIPLSVMAGLSMALCTWCAWTIWFRMEWAAQRSVMWTVPHHLETLIVVPVLLAMQSTWFAMLCGACNSKRQRVVLWAAVPLAAFVLFFPASRLALSWWSALSG